MCKIRQILVNSVQLNIYALEEHSGTGKAGWTCHVVQNERSKKIQSIADTFSVQAHRSPSIAVSKPKVLLLKLCL